MIAGLAAVFLLFAAAQDKHLEPNPDANNLYHRLKRTSSDSGLMRQDETMEGEEQSELLKTMFEGQGSQNGKVLTQQEKPSGKDAAGGALGASYYDRLSRGNLRGYSPQLQVLQSQLNARRAPGAPKLVETGKLDYETLSYPLYGMRQDIGGLERRLRLDRNLDLARLAGRTGLSESQLLDPEMEAQLKAQAAAKGSLSPRFERRQRALEKAALAARAFDAAALPSKDPSRITVALLKTLGAKQQDAARWITAAFLEEDLQRLEPQENFLSGELLELIARAPVDAAARAAYKARGEELKARFDELKADDTKAVEALEAEDWLPKALEVEGLLAKAASLRAGLSRRIDDYCAVPPLLAARAQNRARWQAWLESAIVRFAPSSAYGREIAARERDRSLLRQAFLSVASGDFEAGRSVIAALQPRGLTR